MRGGGGGWSGAARAGHQPLPVGALPGPRGKGSLAGRPDTRSAAPPGEAGLGPGGADGQPPRLRGDEAFSSLLLPPPDACAARTAPVSPRAAPGPRPPPSAPTAAAAATTCPRHVGRKRRQGRSRSGRKRRPRPGRQGGRREAAGRGALAFCPPRGRATGGAERREAAERGGAEMAAATWELGEEEGQGFPSGPPAPGGGGGDGGGGGGGRLPRDAPPAPAGRVCRGWGRGLAARGAALLHGGPEEKRAELRLTGQRAESGPGTEGGEKTGEAPGDVRGVRAPRGAPSAPPGPAWSCSPARLV